MFVNFFLELRKGGVPTSLKEYLALLEAMQAGLADYKVDHFYYLSRSALVKDEKNFDKFDRVFGHCFKGLESLDDEMTAEIPEEWLKALAELVLTEEEKAEIEALGGWEKLMETLRQRLEEQQKRHEGGNKWIGTGGTSPFGAYGYNPEGVRIGQDKSRHRRAVKVWDKREYRNFDDQVVLGTRNIKVALRRLRRFAREGAELELDLPDTIRSTAARHHPLHRQQRRLPGPQAGARAPQHGQGAAAARRGRLDGRPHPHLRGALLGHPDRVQAPGVLLLPQLPLREGVEGQPPPPLRVHSDLGGAAHLPRRLQADLRGRRHHEPLRGGLPGALDIYQKAIWLNPVPEQYWDYTPSIQILRELMTERMFPLTLEGLERAMKELSR
jgi:uncharacterized protein with von Willebrand factor type A (vWA) domain